MSVGEVDTFSGKSIDIGGSSLRVSTKAADPVIQVVDGDKQDIGGCGRHWARICKK